MSDRRRIKNVGALSRVIAAGIEKRGDDRWVGLATLSLIPWVGKKDAAFARPVMLETWPEDVECLLAGLRLHVCPIDPKSRGRLEPRCTDLGIGIPVRRSATLPEEERKRANRLWQKLIAGADPTAWRALEEVLRKGQAGDSLGEITCPPAAVDGGAAATITPAPQPGNTNDSRSGGYPDVIDYPRADAALLYGLQRAREVLRAIEGKQHACRVGKCVIRTGGRFLDLATFNFDRKPWLGLDETRVRLAQSTQSDVPPFGALEGFARHDRMLAEERTAQETTYRRQLAEKTEKAKKQSTQRSAYLAGNTVEARIAALKGHAAERASSLAPNACADACGPAGDSIAHELTDQVKSAHSLGALPDVDQVGNLVVAPKLLDDAFDIAIEETKQRLFSIMAMPSLARLFNLVVDVEFELDDLLLELGLNRDGTNDDGFEETCAVDHYGNPSGFAQIEGAPPANERVLKAHYLFLTSNLGRSADFVPTESGTVEGDPPRVWTLAKFRRPRPDQRLAEAGHFWPCTREEVDIRLHTGRDGDRTGSAIRDACAVFQFDGVVDLGVTYCADNGVRNPRYEIVSLDTMQTVESDMQSDRRFQQQAKVEEGNRLPSVDLGVQTRRTGGLAVVDRWRQDQVVSQITTARHHIRTGTSEIVLDAEDMTSAYRLDVGVDIGGANQGRALVWRCLMNRTMRFGAAADGSSWLEAAIDRLYDWGNSTERRQRRRRADGASLSIASRVRDNGSERADRAAKTVFAEQVMIAWHGDPLGVDCIDPCGSIDPHGSSEVSEEQPGLSIPATGLPLEIRYGLAQSDDVEAYRPPPLRYGWPYHLGLRPVYLGGVILPLQLAIPRYELNFGTGSSLPIPAEQVGRRFLRHERVEAPVLTLPHGIADEFNKLQKLSKQQELNQQDKGKPQEIDRALGATGATCLLRTSLCKGHVDVGPASTSRILFPPIMQLEQAALHGVCDRDDSETHPKDGLKPLDFTGDPSAPTKGGFPHAASLPGNDARGPAVFRLGGQNKKRDIPFYPDPAATSYVIAVRRPQSDDYLDDPIVVPAYSKEKPKIEYPDVLPLAIEIRKRKGRPRPATRVRDLVRDLFPKDCSVAYANRSGNLTGSHSDGLPVRHAIAELAPGEDFEIEVWCIPSVGDLRKYFDIVESVAVLLMRESGSDHFAEGRLDDACLDSLARYFPDLDESWKRETLPGVRAGEGAPEALELNPLCGPGGHSLPRANVMDRVAEAICTALRRRPMPELAATTRIHAIHAVDKPLIAPSFANQAKPPAAVRLVRLSDATREALMDRNKPQPPKVRRLCDNEASWEHLSDDGATNAIFDGAVEVDLLTTHDVELHAIMASPASAVFDDVKRGRSPEEKARGAYRPVGWVPDLRKQSSWPALPQAFGEKQSRSLYGFTVAADGRVRLAKSEAPLMALHRLSEVPLSQRAGNVRPIKLLDQQQQAAQADQNAVTQEADPAAQPCRVQYLQTFRDGLARQLELMLVATSRFSNLFPIGENEDPSARQLKSKPHGIWLPATKRPDALSAKSLRPSFVWTHAPKMAQPAIGLAPARRTVTTARACSIHVPFERPHFTSGEGERVGIVIWPPDLILGAGADEIADDRVRRSEQANHTIRLDDKFSDSDMGPGGEFVTRWGADPIREGPRPKGWLIPAEAFLDHGDPSNGAQLVRNVLMPIPRKPDPGQENGAGDSRAKSINDKQGKTPDESAGRADDRDAVGREFMLVSLLTYEPRFDIDFERWYLDVRIDAGKVPEPFIRLGLVRYQEHARPELQLSEPIAQWVQLMPKRTISVSIEPPAQLSQRVELALEVSTPAAYDGSAPRFDPGSGEVDEAGSAPFIRAYVLRKDTTSAGATIQTIVAPEDAVDSPSTQLVAERTAKGTAWRGRIGFTCRNDADASTDYSVFVEEVQAFQAAANPFDAETGEATRRVVESGPRFAAIVPISLAPVTKKETSLSVYAQASVPEQEL